MKIVPELLDADYRLPYKVFEEVYKLKHTGMRDSVYGLTASDLNPNLWLGFKSLGLNLLHPEVEHSNLIANPGRYPTGAILALAR